MAFGIEKWGGIYFKSARRIDYNFPTLIKLSRPVAQTLVYSITIAVFITVQAYVDPLFINSSRKEQLNTPRIRRNEFTVSVLKTAICCRPRTGGTHSLKQPA
jgi:hypothetical protein